MLTGIVRTGFDGTAKCKLQRDKYLDAVRKNELPLVLSQSWMTYGDALHSELNGSVPRTSSIEVGASASRTPFAISAHTAENS